MKNLSRLMTAIAFALATVACAQTDSGVTTRIKAKFAQDDLVKAHEINVTTQDHIVTLTGNVDSIETKNQAVLLARDTDGVRNVVDELKIDVAATTGEHGDIDVDHDVEAGAEKTGNALEQGAKATGNAIKKGAEKTVEGAKRVGGAVRDAVTDKDRDSDRDGH